MCLGDKPEVAYRSHREWLASAWLRIDDRSSRRGLPGCVRGRHAAAHQRGNPHPEELEALRPWNASMGLMLETTSTRLRGKGMPHQHCARQGPVGAHPHARARRRAEDSRSRPGMLLGIGENVAERVDTLLTIRDLQDRYGHIQEDDRPALPPEAGNTDARGVALRDEEVAGWVGAGAARSSGPEMNVQAPPNLAPEVLELLLRSG